MSTFWFSCSLVLLWVRNIYCAPPLGFLPNIIIFYADDYGYGDMESYGHPYSITPNLDKLSAEGTKLTSFYSSSPVCSPSRAALLTGRFQTRTGIWPGVFNADSVGGLPETEITIAKFLKMNGLAYKSSIIGKWHLGTGGPNGTYLPTNRGFDFYTGIPYSHDMPDPPYCFPNKRRCWPHTPMDPWNDTCVDSNDPYPIETAQAIAYKQQYEKFKQESKQSGTPVTVPLQLQRSENVYYKDNVIGTTSPPLPLYYNKEIIQQPVNMTMIPSWYTNAAISFINESVFNKDNFFLYYAFHQTHHPQFASSKFFNKTQRGMFGDAEAEMDYNIGLIMNFIKSIGIDNETFVFFSSDNGPSLQRETRGGNALPLKCGKGTTYEGGQRMPAVAWMPGYIPNGKISRQMGSMLDILPTIAELVDKQLPTDRYYDGYSMFDWLFKNGTSKRNVFYYWPEKPSPSGGWQQSLHAVRVNQYKMHWIVGGSHCHSTYYDKDCSNGTKGHLETPLLFNLYHDVGENYPLNVSESYYKNIVININKSWEFILNTQGLWGESEINKGSSQQLAPCCHWNCTDNWPQCCECDKINNTFHFIDADFVY